MEPTKKTFKETLSEINPRDLIYPGIIAFFALIVFILFIFSTKFISKNINAAFTGDTSGPASSLNMGAYTLVAKKLGITAGTNISKDGASQGAIPTVTKEKSALSINILNATNTSGIAGALAKSLESAGYAKATVGSSDTLSTETTVSIKDSVAQFGPIILEEVRRTYPNATATTTIETAQYDVVITIGEE